MTASAQPPQPQPNSHSTPASAQTHAWPTEEMLKALPPGFIPWTEARIARVGMAIFIALCIGFTLKALIAPYEYDGSSSETATAAIDQAATPAPVEAVTLSPEDAAYVEALLKATDVVEARRVVITNGPLADKPMQGDVTCQLSGYLQPSQDTRLYFDYWLSAMPPASLEQVRTLMLHDIVDRSGKHCVKDAALTFSAYQSIKHKEQSMVKAVKRGNFTVERAIEEFRKTADFAVTGDWGNIFIPVSEQAIRAADGSAEQAPVATHPASAAGAPASAPASGTAPASQASEPPATK